MQELAFALTEKVTQCWTCEVFGNLFDIISNAAGLAYGQLSTFSFYIFATLFCFYMLNAFWQQLKSDKTNQFFETSLKPVFIKSLIALSLLACGLMVPQFISRVTFEPVATITLEYSKSIIQLDKSNVSKTSVSDDTLKTNLKQDSMFNQNLRNTILQTLKSTVSNFQTYIEMGIAIIDSSFTIPIPITVDALVKRILAFFVGLTLTYSFVGLFIKYSFCFIDIIVAMAMFAFFFPISLVLFVFKDAPNIPDWLKNFGKSVGVNQIKNLINAIVSMASAILTYTVIMLLISGYLKGNNITPDMIQNNVGSIFDFDLDNPNALQVTFFGSLVLVFILNYIAKQIPNITKEIMSTFAVSEQNSMSQKVGDDVLKLTDIVKKDAKQVIKDRISPETKSESTTKTDTTTTTKATK